MGVVEDVRAFADLIRKYNDIELNRQIVSLENEVLDLTRDKRRLEEQVEQLQSALKFKKELVFKAPFYWLEDDKTPYCPGCWESKRVAVHLQDKPQTFGQMICPACKHSYSG
jgi:hypothetical protein